MPFLCKLPSGVVVQCRTLWIASWTLSVDEGEATVGTDVDKFPVSLGDSFLITDGTTVYECGGLLWAQGVAGVDSTSKSAIVLGGGIGADKNRLLAGSLVQFGTGTVTNPSDTVVKVA